MSEVLKSIVLYECTCVIEWYLLSFRFLGFKIKCASNSDGGQGVGTCHISHG